MGAWVRAAVLMAGVALATGCANPVISAAQPGAPAQTSPTVTLVDVEHGIAVVGVSAECCGNQEQGRPHLWLSTVSSVSTGGTQWRDITPAAVTHPAPSGDFPMFESASFLSATIGWVTTYDPATARVTIYRTRDGGRTWTSIPGGGHTPNAGAITRVQLLTPTSVILETVQPTAPSTTLRVSTDAGATWHTVFTGPPTTSTAAPLGQVLEFTSRARGFAAFGIPPADPLTGPDSAGLMRTADGGATWTRLPLPLPWASSSCPADATDTWCWTGVPVFFDTRTGVIAAERLHASTATVAFDTSSDGGMTWASAASLTVPIPPRQTNQADTPAPIPPTPSGALVCTPSSHAWWVLTRLDAGVTTRVSTDRGARWTTAVSTTPLGRPTGLYAVDASRALLTTTVATSSGNHVSAVWVTTDSGHTWRRLFG